MASLCSGAYVLAEAGLLDGNRPRPTGCTPTSSARYPQIDLDPGVLYFGDGQVWTSAGTAAAIDLCLHFVRLDHGAEAANVVARRMVIPPHRDGGQAQYVDSPFPRRADNDLAARSTGPSHTSTRTFGGDAGPPPAMAPRTFARRFKLATGTTPLQWLLTQRVVLAQRLLETTTCRSNSSPSGAASGRRPRCASTSVASSASPQAYRSTFGRLAG